MQRFLPGLVFLGTSALGLALSYSVYSADRTAGRLRIEGMAREAAQRVQVKVDHHIAVLEGVRALIDVARATPPRTDFRDMVAHFDLRDAYLGIQGVGYAEVIPPGGEAAVSARIKADYGLDRTVWPESAQPLRTSIVMLEPDDERNRAALGYDMYSEANRRQAMDNAWATGLPRATAPVQLKQEITSEKQPGFLIYVPVFAQGQSQTTPTGSPQPISGFVYAPFRAGDLHAAAFAGFDARSAAVESYDVSSGAPALLYRSPGFDEEKVEHGRDATAEVRIAGRTWQFHVVEGQDFVLTLRKSLGPLLALISLVLAGALGWLARAQLRSADAAHRLSALSQKALDDKDLLLQEMNHRIKNLLARVTAIARATANGSADMQEFNTTFQARLQAMATAQDTLARSHWERASFRQLLRNEMEQVFGAQADNMSLTGPDFELDERAAQAFGLTFHELATNALKYGGAAEQKFALAVDWGFTPDGRLVLEWREHHDRPPQVPERKGFGSRLMEATIRGDLNGAVERVFSQSGVVVTFNVPKEKLVQSSRPDQA